MIKFSNEDGFLELTTPPPRIPLLIRLTDIVAMTDLSGLTDEQKRVLPKQFKGAQTSVKLRNEGETLPVHESVADIIDQIRRP